jgi:parvulin-like peptidyl-prolyl isomerase
MLRNRASWAVAAAVVLATLGVCIAQVATSQPAKPDKILVAIGDKNIMQSDVDKALQGSDLPAYRKDMIVPQLLERGTMPLLAQAYAKAQKLPVDETEFKKQVEDLRANLALSKFYTDATTEEKTKAYMKEHPSFFDGTRVRASHILLNCPSYSSTKDQQEAYAKLQGIRDDIEKGKITFVDAAKKYSQCPSAPGGGDLGEFDFVGQMDPVFAYWAFSTKKNEMSPVIRTSFGWHIIMPTDIKQGDGIPKPWQDPQSGRTVAPDIIANQSIRSNLNNQILLTAAKECQVVNYTELPKTDQPK